MAPPLRDFRDLRVYREAYAVAMELHERSKRWPKEERYALTDQVRRSSRSVCAKLAEAWFKRRYPRHFTSKLSDAGAEATETLVWLDMAHDFGYLDAPEADSLRDRTRHVIGGLVKMMTSPEQWCRPTSVREPSVGYDAEASGATPPEPASGTSSTSSAPRLIVSSS